MRVRMCVQNISRAVSRRAMIFDMQLQVAKSMQKDIPVNATLKRMSNLMISPSIPTSSW